MIFRSVTKFLCVLGSLSFLGAHTGYANALTQTPTTTIVVEQLEGLQADGAGFYRLHASAEVPPAAAAFDQTTSFQRYGFLLSSPQVFEQAAFAYQIRYTAEVPEGTELRVDARASADGVRWSSWEVDLANGAVVDATMLATQVQYRVTFFGSDKISPVLKSVSLTPIEGAGNYTAMNTQTTREIAPTYRVHATRMGMVGGRTANGHIIKPRDHYVSLPSWRSLSSKGGREYLVRITYNGRSSVAPVWDVGPWNTRDNYWDVEREQWKDLARGWPQDHAAYFEGYNGRRASKGYVRFPTAVDVGDGVWWDDLGIRGDRAIVEITFLWLGEDPLAVTPTPSEAATTEAAPESTAEVAETATLEATSESTAELAETATLEATSAPSNAVPSVTVEATSQPTGSAETSQTPVATVVPSESPEPSQAPSEASQAQPTSTVITPTASQSAQTAEPSVQQCEPTPTELPPTATPTEVEATTSVTQAPATATATVVPSASLTAQPLATSTPTTSVTTTATITATAVLTETIETTAPSSTPSATIDPSIPVQAMSGERQALAQQHGAYRVYAFWRRESWILP